jgi:hypothetical protein
LLVCLFFDGVVACCTKKKEGKGSTHTEADLKAEQASGVHELSNERAKEKKHPKIQFNSFHCCVCVRTWINKQTKTMMMGRYYIISAC